MPTPIRYGLDLSGSNPDNAVIGEVHTLSAQPIRAIAPIYGPYYADSLLVFDNITNAPLVRGIDFQCVELLQEVTLKSGKEINEVILILNNSVFTTVRINYQTVGGLYQNQATAIINMYETLVNDNRNVDWVNIMNKPAGYNPSLHNHLISDVVGFEPLITAVERLRNAMVLSDVPVFETLMSWVKGRTLDTVTTTEIDQQLPVNKVVTFEMLMYSLNKLNFNSMTISPNVAIIVNGGGKKFNISSTNLYDGTVLFWTIIHSGTTDSNFVTTSGVVNMIGNQGSFTIYTTRSNEIISGKTFKVAIRANGVLGPVLASTRFIELQSDILHEFVDYINAHDLTNPNIDINPASLYLVYDW